MSMHAISLTAVRESLKQISTVWVSKGSLSYFLLK